MKDRQHIGSLRLEPENKKRDAAGGPNPAEVMNHPEQYSEEELRTFFGNPENEADCRYALLARMTEKRRKVAPPDTEQAWRVLSSHIFDSHMGESLSHPENHAFRTDGYVSHSEKPVSSRRKTDLWRMWGAALAGAAAMLVGVFLYDSFYGAKSLSENTASVVAMIYDETPQNITLQSEEHFIDLSQKDSLSFRTSANTTAGRVAPSVDTRSLSPKMQKLSTPRGMDFKVILPDGSEVWINAESTIEFPAAFLGNERRVLLKGEAYFKVARNEECPFVVISDRMKVRVLGTEFNFKSYASETSHVSLVKGSVEVLRADAEQPDAMLNPGQDAWSDENGQIHVREIDTYGVTQWISGFFYFDDLPLVEILRELGRWYNLGVVFRNTAAMHYKIHFSASRHEGIEQAVGSLNRLRKARIAIEGTDIVVY